MSDQLPKPFVRMRDDYPQIAAAYDSLGEAAGAAGPLDDTSQHLVKLGMSIAAGLEGDVRGIGLDLTRPHDIAAALAPVPTVRHVVISAIMRDANTVRDYLVSRGIPAERLTALGAGPDNPVVSNDTAEGRSRNRRIEFNIMQ